MTTLFAISVAAFVALMWAVISTVRHVQKARRRRNMARTLPTAPAFSPEASRAAAALAAGSWGRNSRTDWKTPPPAETPAPPPPAEAALTSSAAPTPRPILSIPAPPATRFVPAQPEPLPASRPILAIPTPVLPAFAAPAAPVQRPVVEVVVAPLAAPEALEEPTAGAARPSEIKADPTPAEPAPSSSAIRFPLSSQRRSSSSITIAADFAEEIPEEIAPETPLGTIPSQPNGSSSSITNAANFQLRRPPATTSSAYFNKDMGDLRDPEPRFRERPRNR